MLPDCQSRSQYSLSDQVIGWPCGEMGTWGFLHGAGTLATKKQTPAISGCPGQSIVLTLGHRAPSPCPAERQDRNLTGCFHQPESFGPSLGTVCVSGHTAGCPHPLLSSAKLTFPRLPGLQEVGSSCPVLPTGNLLFLFQASTSSMTFHPLHTVRQMRGTALIPQTEAEAHQGATACPRSQSKLGAEETQRKLTSSPVATPCYSPPSPNSATGQGSTSLSSSFMHSANTLRAFTEHQLHRLQTMAL